MWDDALDNYEHSIDEWGHIIKRSLPLSTRAVSLATIENYLNSLHSACQLRLAAIAFGVIGWYSHNIQRY